MTQNINELYQRARAGEDRAEEGLFLALRDKFRLFAHHRVWNRQEAEDLVQEALMVVTKEYRRVEIETSFSAWAHKVLQNRLLGYIQERRREKGRHAPEEACEYVAGSWTPDPDLKMQLLHCLKKLVSKNHRYARIINLHQLGFTKKEVCERLGLHLQQSYLVMSRARAMLKECLDKGDIGR